MFSLTALLLRKNRLEKVGQISNQYGSGDACMAAKGRKVMAQVAIDMADGCSERGAASIQLRQQGEGIKEVGHDESRLTISV